MPKLAIVSVSYKSEKYLEMNHSLVSKSCSDFTWFVVKNNFTDKIDTNKFVVFHGSPPTTRKVGDVGPASFHLGMAQDMAISLLQDYTSDIILFLHPDCFVLYNQTKIINHILNNNISFFGTPYAKARKCYNIKFPVEWCLYVNRHMVDIKDLEFCPDPDTQPDYLCDTGHIISERFSNSNHKFESTKSDVLDYGFSKDITDHPQYNTTVSSTDFYRWNSDPFAVHFHCKRHNPNIENIKPYELQAKIIKEITR